MPDRVSESAKKVLGYLKEATNILNRDELTGSWNNSMLVEVAKMIQRAENDLAKDRANKLKDFLEE